MPNIKPISELRNYGEVLRDVVIGSPVFLTKNGHGRYAVMDIEEYREYEKMLAWRQLKSELEKGARSGEEKGWIDADTVKAQLEGQHGGQNTVFSGQTNGCLSAGVLTDVTKQWLSLA